MKNWLVKRENKWIFAWVILSIVLALITSLFRINDLVSTPQHGMFSDFTQITNYIQKNNKLFWYRAFFVADMFWAATFLMVIRNIIAHIDAKNMLQIKRFSLSLLQIFSCCAVVAYGFDLLEGLGYVFYWDSMLPWVVKCKQVFYVFCVLFFVYYLLKEYVFTDFRSVFRFVQTSILSIVFIAIVYLLLTVMPQGGTLIVALFYSPFNVILLFALLTFLAILLSHFPVYVDIWLNDLDDTIKLVMSKRRWQFLGLGIIYYSTFKDPNNPVNKALAAAKSSLPPAALKAEQQKEERRRFSSKRVASMRRSLGILLYIAVFNIVLGVVSRFYEGHLSVNGISFGAFLICLIIYNEKGKTYSYWKEVLYHGIDPSEQQMVVKAIVKYVSFFPKYIAICVFLVLVTALLVWQLAWSKYTIVAFFITLGFQTFLYIYFKICRTYFKYVFYSPKLKEYSPKMFNSKLFNLFKTYDSKHGKRTDWYSFQHGRLSDNVRYLGLMQFAGLFSFGLLVWANLSFEFASQLNPLIIIVLYIIYFYSAIIITFKHVLYYHREKSAPRKYRTFYRYGVPISVLFIFGWMGYSVSLDNDLHDLRVAPREQVQISSKNYLINRTQNIPVGSKENFFFVGSYGGGLKANLWNLLLFNRIDKHTGDKFRKRTLVMSGVSGGAVGIANYASLVANKKDQKEREEAIFNIGNSNVLSNELVYLMGKDWIREYLPVKHNGTDRSYVSMKEHARLTGMGNKYNRVTYSDYWRYIYAQENGEFPILLMNSTSTRGRQGIASTVSLLENTFPAADILSDLDATANTDLMYYGAVSTTNRFPLFSPSAAIPTKGNYVDGGYFENSGMLSALEIYETLEKEGGIYSDKIQPIFINIINSQDYYIRHKVENEWGFNKPSQSNTGELAAILNTVVSIDKLPPYVLAKIKKKGYVVEEFMMPHKINYQQVKAVLRGDVDDPIRLMKEIKAHNKTIDSVLRLYKPYKLKKWGVVTPPLARILSEPAVRYQEAMIAHHPEVIQALDLIDAYLQADTIVDTKFRENLKDIRFLNKQALKKFNTKKQQ